MRITTFLPWGSTVLRVVLVTLCGIAVLLPFRTQAMAAETEVAAYLAGLPFRDLLDLEVSTVARKPVTVSHTAAAVYVITDDDIRRSGATSIAEVLRMVPGFEVARQTSSVWNINARGGNNRFANSLLVLIDNRSVYTPLFGGVYWDVQDVLLEDVERIEAVRGPGASLWGTNAISGVVNIVTKHSADTQGGLVMGGLGNEERLFGAGRFGGAIGDYATYRIYTKYFDRGDGSTREGGSQGDGWDMVHTGFRIDWNRRGRETLRVSGDVYSGNVDQFSASLERVRETDVTGGNLLARWDRKFSDTSDAALQVYYDRTERNNSSFGENLDTVDIDFQHRFSPFSNNDLVWGLGYRSLRSETADDVVQQFDPRVRTDSLMSGFVQDEISLIPGRLNLIIGTKLEDNDYTGFEIQPSVKFVGILGDTTVLWGSVARALTTPNRHNSDVKLEIDIPGMGPFLVLRGNPDLDVEEGLVYELGLRGRFGRKGSLDVAAFFTDQSDIVSTDYDAMGTSTFSNQRDVEAWGVELALEYRLQDWWKLAASYTFLEITSSSDPGSSAEQRQEELLAERVDPENQFHIRSYMNLPHHVQFDAALYYVDSLPLRGTGGLDTVDGYVRMDVRLGWEPMAGLDISLVAQNIFDPDHPEAPDNGTLRAGQIERSVYGKVTWNF